MDFFTTKDKDYFTLIFNKLSTIIDLFKYPDVMVLSTWRIFKLVMWISATFREPIKSIVFPESYSFF